MIVSLTGALMSGFAWLMIKKIGDSMGSTQIMFYFGCVVVCVQFMV